MYDYLEAMREDVKGYISENITLTDYIGNREGLEEELNDDLWIEDSVTGNASGSYTFNRATAEEYVKENLDLLKDAAREFCCEDRLEKWFFDEEYEDADVTIRCYLLGQIISEVLDELEESGVFEEPEIKIDEIA